MNNLRPYRAWHIKNKIMHEVLAIDFKYKLIAINEYREPEANYREYIEKPLNEFILMQSTELKDKNGVEIFEGDIVKAFLDDERGYAITAVWYLGPRYLLANYTSGKLDGSFEMADWGAGEEVPDFEIIGNRYKNTNLLGGNEHDL